VEYLISDGLTPHTIFNEACNPGGGFDQVGLDFMAVALAAAYEATGDEKYLNIFRSLVYNHRFNCAYTEFKNADTFSYQAWYEGENGICPDEGQWWWIWLMPYIAKYIDDPIIYYQIYCELLAHANDAWMTQNGVQNPENDGAFIRFYLPTLGQKPEDGAGHDGTLSNLWLILAMTSKAIKVEDERIFACRVDHGYPYNGYVGRYIVYNTEENPKNIKAEIAIPHGYQLGFNYEVRVSPESALISKSQNSPTLTLQLQVQGNQLLHIDLVETPPDPKRLIIRLLSDVKVYDDDGVEIPGVVSAAWPDEHIFKEADWQITVGPVAGARAEILDIGAWHKAVREHIQVSIWVKRKHEANYTPERLRRDLIQEVDRILFKAIDNLSGVEGVNLSGWIDRDEPQRGILRSILTVQVEYEKERM